MHGSYLTVCDDGFFHPDLGRCLSSAALVRMFRCSDQIERQDCVQRPFHIIYMCPPLIILHGAGRETVSFLSQPIFPNMMFCLCSGAHFCVLQKHQHMTMYNVCIKILPAVHSHLMHSGHGRGRVMHIYLLIDNMSVCCFSSQKYPVWSLSAAQHNQAVSQVRCSMDVLFSV